MNDKIRFLWLFFLLLSLVVLPLVRLPFFALEFEFSKFVAFYFFGIVLLFFVGIHTLREKAREKISKDITLPLFFFVAIYLVSSVFSITPLVSIIGYFGGFTGGLIYIFFSLVFFYSAFVLRQKKKLILQMIFLSGFLVAIYGLWQYLNEFWYTHNLIFRVYSTIGQPNRLAFFLLALLPIDFFLFWQEEKKLFKIIYAFGLLISLLVFFLTFSRSAYVVLLILFGLISYYICHCEPREVGRGNLIKFKITSLSRLAGLLAMTVILLFLLFGFLFAKTIPSTISNFSQSSLSLRLAEWQGSWAAIIDRPVGRQLIGFGPETVYFTFFKHRPLIYNQSKEEQGAGPGQVRNYYLHLLSGIGILGLLGYLYLLKQILERAWQNGKDNPLAKSIFFSLLGILLYSFFYYQTDVVLPVFWILAGLVVSNKTVGNHFNDIYHYSSRVISLLTILAVPVLFYGLYRAVLAHYYASQNPSEFNFIKATQLNPLFDVYKRNLSKLYLNKMMSLKDKDKKTAEEKFFLAQNAAEKALQTSPLDIRNVRQLLLVKYLAGVNINKKYHQGNIELAQKLTSFSPTDPLSWDFLGLVYLDLGKLEEAKTAFGKEKTLNPNQPGVYLHLGEVLKQQGKIQEAIELYKKAVSLAPGWDLAEKELKKALEL